MPETSDNRQDGNVHWNALTSGWLEVMSLDAECWTCSPLEALARASEIRCIALASPLDVFAAHRFLLTLLYWKADAQGGIDGLREALLGGTLPQTILQSLETENGCFQLFDDNAPFLQDPSAPEKDTKSAGSLFAELATGTNIAHFHHGNDDKLRLCMRCATLGMLRVVPWTQSGGAGLTPSVHNAPPIMVLAVGSNLANTLGLNLVPLDGEKGTPKWSGWFSPTDKDKPIPYLEALTWNPRRIRLPLPRQLGTCWHCGRAVTSAIGPIIYLKNPDTGLRKVRQKTVPFMWTDPSAFYREEAPYITIKSSREAVAANGRDLDWLLTDEDVPQSIVGTANPMHQGWNIIIPCINPTNNKTYDHRLVTLDSLSGQVARKTLATTAARKPGNGLDGWIQPRKSARRDGSTQFVRAAFALLSHADWMIFSRAEYKKLHESPAAFDVFSGLYWSSRRRIVGLPSKGVLWLVLKLMASVPQNARFLHFTASHNPLACLPKRQPDELRRGRACMSRYPQSFPQGQRLESELRRVIDLNMRKRKPEWIDWASLCHGLDQLLG